MEPQSALVRAEHAVELHPHSSVDVHLAGIVLPRHPEQDLALGFTDPLDDLVFREFRVLGHHWAEALEYLAHGLVKLDLAGIAPDDTVYLYCFKGARASNTFLALKQAGFSDVRMYFGSWNEWSRDESLPIETGLPVAASAKASKQPEMALAA